MKFLPYLSLVWLTFSNLKLPDKGMISKGDNYETDEIRSSMALNVIKSNIRFVFLAACLKS